MLLDTISKDYGVIKIETFPTVEQTQSFTTLIRKQVSKQTFKENVGKYANSMFHYGLRWGRKSGMIKPVSINSFAGKSEFYGYDTVDQNGNPLPSIDNLKPIINEIENHLGIDMTHYDSVIGNIYLVTD